MGRTNKTGVDWSDQQSINQHLTLRRAEKRQKILEDENYVSPKIGRPTIEEHKKVKCSDIVKCEVCNIDHRLDSTNKHKRSAKHIKNVEKQSSFI